MIACLGENHKSVLLHMALYPPGGHIYIIRVNTYL